MEIKIGQIAHARSGDKGSSSNVGLIFYSEEVYVWAKGYITAELVKEHFQIIRTGHFPSHDPEDIFQIVLLLSK